MKKGIIVLVMLMLMVGCSKKVITEEEAIQAAKEDLKISDDTVYNVILGNDAYNEEKQEYTFNFITDEGDTYIFVVDAISGEIKDKQFRIIN